MNLEPARNRIITRHGVVRYDYAVFKRWLFDQPADQIVGYSRDSSRCPLKECFGQAVDERGYKIPTWADLFLGYIDIRGFDPKVEITESEPVTAAQALAICDEMERKYGTRRRG